MTSGASNLWKVSHFFHVGRVTYIHAIGLPRLSLFVFFLKAGVIFAFNYIMKQITGTQYFFGIFIKKYDLIILWKNFPIQE